MHNINKEQFERLQTLVNAMVVKSGIEKEAKVESVDSALSYLGRVLEHGVKNSPYRNRMLIRTRR